VIYTEAVSNPTLVVADLPALSEIAHAQVCSHLLMCLFMLLCSTVLATYVLDPMQGLQFVVDNTFSPLIITPARWGADVVVHSLTKFISGASDIVAGTV
jgi:methionine-gamma-lyase